ncbi:MAG: hypothetical protein A2017_05620 [Lentisphaerae bacterium GWF2_44_16]|nr:MAG: hypothetical protein A2017_05620 [Lentisphaerae bacterium GWF2_44_16]
MKRENGLKIIILMIDGFGVPPEGWENSVYRKYCGDDFINLFAKHSVPVDACLGIDGIPQSATGQCALFTGINAAEIMGRHVQGFPGPSIRKIIREQNIFSTLIKKGKSVAFANAYVYFDLQKLRDTRRSSVTSVMTECSLGYIRDLQYLLRGEAVYHDLTRKSMSGDFDIPEITPSESASHLIKIAEENDLTLFEYFLTDRAGHKSEEETLGKVLSELGDFICALSKKLPEEMALIVTSDHGNCEDFFSASHTKNPVPLLVCGALKTPPPGKLKSLTDIYEFVNNLF